MSDLYAKPYLYDQTDDVIARYEDKARVKLEMSALIPTVDEPIENGKHFDLIQQVANEMWLDENTH